MTRISQPVAMITGGNRGIGRGIAERLLQEGWAVAILATRPADDALLAELGNLGPVHYTQGSVAELADHERFLAETVETWGRVDALVNNAGVAPIERLDILVATPESYDRVLDINLRGPYFLTQKVAAKMIALRGDYDPTTDGPIGTIVNVTSISSEVVSTNRGEYCISKAGMTKLLAIRLAEHGIPVYEVSPGIIRTEMTKVVTAKYDKYILEDGNCPIARWGEPEDVDEAVIVLAEGRLKYSTGDIIYVDGGMRIPVL